MIAFKSVVRYIFKRLGFQYKNIEKKNLDIEVSKSRFTGEYDKCIGFLGHFDIKLQITSTIILKVETLSFLMFFKGTHCIHV